VANAEGIHPSVTAYESADNLYASRDNINAVVEAHRVEPKRKVPKPSAEDLAVLAAYVALSLQMSENAGKSVRLDTLASVIAEVLDQQKHLAVLKVYFCGPRQSTAYRNFSAFMQKLSADPRSGVIGKVQDPTMTTGYYRYLYPGD
jgi:ADP-heptose:LPS heptosyltransferase